MSPEKSRYVFYFGDGAAEGDPTDKALLGGKGAGLAHMTSMGLPVPPGFTISTDACAHYFREGGSPEGLDTEVNTGLSRIEASLSKTFGDVGTPLLLSVRSGAAVSMPGMMDTVLNLGLNDETVKGLFGAGERFAWDSYRRFIQMYGDVVLNVEHHLFEAALARLKTERGVANDTELSPADLQGLVETYKQLVLDTLGRPFPLDPREQLWGAINAVFDSWNAQKAVDYRRIAGISGDLGTAVNVQAMVFGNMGDDCATGVAFTRDASTGEPGFNGEYLINAQGEDVVAGIRTPLQINGPTEGTLEKVMPAAYAEMHAIQVRLEAHYRDMLDLEFTIEQGRLFMLQTRVGKRTARSAIRIAYDLVQEGVIDKTEAILRIPAHRFEEASRPDLKDPAKLKSRTLARGIAASPGVVSGYPVFTAAEAVARKNEAVILVRPETSPDDIAGMAVAVGILTQRGGATSHAAVVARGMGKTCVAGCDGIEVDTGHHVIRIGDRIISGEDLITLDGARGILIEGAVETVPPKLGKDFYEVLRWAEELSSIKVRANADTPEDARVARELGAEGIGLCRTEHMFFGEDRILAVQEMILANTPESRQKALDLLLPMQREDFEGIFEAMEGLPVTIRLLDPPLHEFLPHTTEDIRPLMPRLGLSMEVLKARVARLEEANPMLGHRGCRLALTYPEIAVMQTQAIISAACAVVKSGKTVLPEIMIPLVAFARELEILRALVVKTADATLVEEGVTLNYMVGTMIELPRAALTADEVAEHAEFFSFGTNDLTQTTLGLSRDDSGRFLQTYLDQGIMLADPFATMDDAVAGLVAQAVKKGRQTRPGMKMGICGEHGGDPDSVAKCVAMGLDYVSCSPYRVPVARMAAAHAALAG